jgi:hypothetical protein
VNLKGLGCGGVNSVLLDLNRIRSWAAMARQGTISFLSRILHLSSVTLLLVRNAYVKFQIIATKLLN